MPISAQRSSQLEHCSLPERNDYWSRADVVILCLSTGSSQSITPALLIPTPTLHHTPVLMDPSPKIMIFYPSVTWKPKLVILISHIAIRNLLVWSFFNQHKSEKNSPHHNKSNTNRCTIIWTFDWHQGFVQRNHDEELRNGCRWFSDKEKEILFYFCWYFLWEKTEKGMIVTFLSVEAA